MLVTYELELEKIQLWPKSIWEGKFSPSKLYIREELSTQKSNETHLSEEKQSTRQEQQHMLVIVLLFIFLLT
jgi:hypothetical protein